MASVVIARFNLDGQLLSSNAGFSRLCPAATATGPGPAWYSFVQPRLDALAQHTPDAEGIVYQGRITLGLPDGAAMRTLHGTVLLADGELLVLAGYDIDEFERIAEQLSDLNNALDASQRDLIRSNRELARREALIRTLSLTDALTGLGNRRHLDEALSNEKNRAQRYGKPATLIILDIDHFKRINDHYGHEAGDRVLQAIGALLRASLRQTDFAARMGGEEFVIIMPETSLSEGQASAERLRAAVAGNRLSELPDITASFGVAQLAADEPENQWLARADTALYQAKTGGRNRVVCAAGSRNLSAPP